MLTNLSHLLGQATREGYAVGAFNAINLDFAGAIIEAARFLRAPVILNIAEVHFKYACPEHIIPAIKAMVEPGDPGLAINLDHGSGLESAERSIRAGFTSVMLDGSRLPYADNVRLTREVVRMAHPLGVSVEAELGAVGGDEGGGLEAAADPDLFTDPIQAGEFVKLTGCDALAVAIGNVHGKYSGEPRLDFERLGKIRNHVTIPLVLHGGSGITDADFRKAISLGISKINFFTGMATVALDTVKSASESAGGRYNSYPDLMLEVRDAVRRVVMEQIRIFGNGHFD